MTASLIRPFALLCIAGLAACSGTGGMSSLGDMTLWPFGEVKEQGRSRLPANAVAYKCQGGKQFYVRDLESGAAAMVTLPDRELRLERDRASSGNRYTRARTVLELEGEGAALTDGADRFTDCTRAGAPLAGPTPR